MQTTEGLEDTQPVLTEDSSSQSSRTARIQKKAAETTRELTPDALSAALKSLADPNRIRILMILAEGETTEKVLVARLMAPQPRVARHIAYLKRHGIISVRKEGRYAVCALKREGGVMRAVKSFVDHMVSSLEATSNVCPR